MELYRKHRPTLWKQIVGQPEVVAILRQKIEAKELPHAIGLMGDSGVGKTTIARIIGAKLGCDESEFVEMNIADFRGIDTARSIREEIRVRPMIGPVKIYFLDEAHKLTTDAQNAMLKILEEPSDFAYFILASSEPFRLIRAIQTRLFTLNLRTLTPSELKGILLDVLREEEKQVPKAVLDRIADAANGSARMALVLLEGCLALKTEKEQLRKLEGGDWKSNSDKLASLLLQKETTFNSIIPTLTAIRDEKIQPEDLRWAVLGYMANLLLGKCPDGMKKRAVMIICAFEINFRDGGYASLERACWEVLSKP